MNIKQSTLLFLLLIFPHYLWAQEEPSIALGGNVRKEIVGHHKTVKGESLFNFVAQLGGFEVREYTPYKVSIRDRVSLYVHRSHGGVNTCYVFNLESDGFEAKKFALRPNDSIVIVKYRSKMSEQTAIKRGNAIKKIKVFFTEEKKPKIQKLNR